jgi:hypothetical protein
MSVHYGEAGDGSVLRELLVRARERFEALSPEEQAAHRREQRISWVYGNLACMRGGPKLTREQVAEMVDRHDREIEAGGR